MVEASLPDTAVLEGRESLQTDELGVVARELGVVACEGEVRLGQIAQQSEVVGVLTADIRRALRAVP